MNIKKLITVGLAVTVAMLQWVAGAEIKVSDVEVFSGYPWKEVVLGYTITGTSSEPRALALEVTDKDTGKKYEGAFSSFSLAYGLDMSQGRHASKWLICTDNHSFKSQNAVFTLQVVPFRNVYCVVDLAGGANADRYPVWYCYRDDMKTWSDEYKTTKLVLRCILPCTFMMGGQYETTLTRPYFIGVFTVTRKQYELVTGVKVQNGMRPMSVETRSGGISEAWNLFRGGSWPDNNKLPAKNSFVGKLRMKTGLNFDGPTEAQWECACRAGTTTKWSFGDSYDESQANAHMWYYWTCFDVPSAPYPHDVGTRLPNPWGLYDMHGNVWEVCLDCFGELGPATDPEGSASGNKVMRGGCYTSFPGGCTSSSRADRGGFVNEADVAWYYDEVGFRLARTVPASEL